MYAEKFMLVSMRGQACADPGARTPIGASGIDMLLSEKLIYRYRANISANPT
jgi:hypothetical protein